MKNLMSLFCWFSLVAAANANTIVDPTKPSHNKMLSASAAKNSTLGHTALKLTAVINHLDTKQAIINGKSVVEGQLFNGFKVLFISQNHVILDGVEGKQTLYVNNNNVKKDTHDDF